MTKTSTGSLQCFEKDNQESTRQSQCIYQTTNVIFNYQFVTVALWEEERFKKKSERDKTQANSEKLSPIWQHMLSVWEKNVKTQVRKHNQIQTHTAKRENTVEYRNAASSTDDNKGCFQGTLQSDEHSWDTLVVSHKPCCWFVTHEVIEVCYP